MPVVGDDHAARIDMRGVHAEMPEGERHDVAGEPLAVARNRVDRARRQFAEHRQALHQLGQLLEMIVERAIELGAIGQRHHLPRFARMEIAQIVHLADVILALAVDSGGRDGQQLVGGLAHRRHDHHGLLRRARAFTIERHGRWRSPIRRTCRRIS